MSVDLFKSFNAPQTVFCLFFAIFWGLVANAQLRWKAFDWPLAIAGRTDGTYKQSWSRVWRSLWYLTIVPVLLFLVLISLLAYAPDRPYGWRIGIQLAFAVLAAHAAFAPYRMWLSVMERKPASFYYDGVPKQCTIPVADHYAAQPWSEPELRLQPTWAKKNLCIACMYVVASTVFACVAVFLG